ncbi:MAG: hypothetical protein R2932_00760 [Caldilineaceae bacterium]
MTTLTNSTLHADLHPAAASYELVVGMEVHAQVKSRSKMFCRCATDYAGAPPNACLPGLLRHARRVTVINKANGRSMTVKTGLALNCTIAERAVFARKNYTYLTCPRLSDRNMNFRSANMATWTLNWTMAPMRTIRIRRDAPGRDTGRSVHSGYYSLIDLNRARRTIDGDRE